jgi:ribose transport system substrate-binding protein
MRGICIGGYWRFARVVAALVAVTAMAGFASACGSNNSSGSSGGSGSTATSGSADSSAKVAEAKKLAEQYTTPPTKINITDKVTKPIPTGKTITFVQCTALACQPMADAMRQAAGVLGWKLRTIITQPTPEAIKASFEQVIREKPDGVVYTGFTRQLMEPQLKQLDALGIPVVASAVPDKPGGALKAVVRGADETGFGGKLAAAWIVANSGGHANVGYLNLPAYAIYASLYTDFVKEMGRLCPQCHIEKLDIPATALGKDAPERVVSLVRRNPAMNYVFSSNDDLLVGVPAALKAAGLQQKVKLVGSAPGLTNLQYIANGEETASLAVPLPELAWWLMDGMVRELSGSPISGTEKALPRVIWTKDNLRSSTQITPVVANYQQQFKQVWGK